EARLLRAVRIHDVDLAAAVTIAPKGDLAAVGRPAGAEVPCGIGGQADRIGAVGAHHVDLEVAVPITRERDLRGSGVRDPGTGPERLWRRRLIALTCLWDERQEKERCRQDATHGRPRVRGGRYLRARKSRTHAPQVITAVVAAPLQSVTRCITARADAAQPQAPVVPVRVP